VSSIERAARRMGDKTTPPGAGQTNPVAIEPVLHDSSDVPPRAAAAAPASSASAAVPLAKVARGEQGGRRIELDLNRMRETGMVTAAGGRTHLVDDFRTIKRPLLKRAFAERAPGENPGNLIMITSSLPGEGKTYCAINLAMSIAMELDHTVLLVDADVAHPSVLRTLGLPGQRGLMDILLDEKTELSDVMLRTNVDTLTILPAANFQSADNRSLLQTFLVGQPEFRTTLHSPTMQQLRQRVIASYHLGPMDAEETQAYIEHRLATVGWKGDPAFSHPAHAAIFQYTGGIPRKVNTLCDRLLLMGYLEELHAFEESHVLEVIQDIAQEFALPADAPQAAQRSLAPAPAGAASLTHNNNE